MNTTSVWVVVIVGIVCLGLGGLGGFGIGLAVSGGIQAINEEVGVKEEPADIEGAREFEHEGLAAMIPGNWIVHPGNAYKTEDGADYFFFQSDGYTSVEFYLYDGPIDVEEQVEAHRSIVNEYLFGELSETTTNSYGGLRGTGINFGDDYFDNTELYNVFVVSGNTKSLVVVENYFEDDSEFVLPGMQLIRDTIQFK